MFAPVFKLSDYASPARSKAAAIAAQNRATDITKGVGPRASQAELDDLERFADLLTEHRERQSKRFDGSRSADNDDTSISTKATSKGSLPGPIDLSASEWEDAFQSATRRKGFRAQVTTKAAISGLGLPAVIQPGLTQTLRTEPDRLLDHLPSTAAESPVIEYISHTGNTNPAATVAELGQKPDLGMQLATKTATMQKIAATASASMESLQDFSTFATFIPLELQRAVVDAETAWAVAQFEAVSGVLARARGASEAPLDTINAAFTDLRVGAAFATANLVALHPATWLYLSSQKDTQGRYLLGEPGSQTSANIWGVPVVQNTKIATGTALVFDTSCAMVWHRMGLTIDSDNGYSASNFATNAVTYRCEERLAVGLLRPAGLSIVTGLAAS